MPKPLENRKIAIIIAFRDFRDEEYFIPKQILSSAGAEVKTVSTSLGTAIGRDGGEVKVNILLDEFKPGDFNAILFIGGPGAAKYIDDPLAHHIAREAGETDRVLGAICVAPAILAKAGVLQGKQATVWSSLMDKSAVKILKEGRAKYLPDPVVVDGKIITANGPAAAREFAQAIIEALARD